MGVFIYALTLEPPGFTIYLKQPVGKMYPLLEWTDFQGTMTNKGVITIAT